MPPFRSLGFAPGQLSPGPLNAITDVQGVQVGHTTLISGDGPLVPGQGPVRTGVTVILPHAGNLFLEKVPAAVHTINGFGKACGFEQVRELGQIEAPIALTNTLNIGQVLDGLVTWSVRASPEIGVTTGTVNIVVGETNDGWINDIQGRHVHEGHVLAALETASGGPVAEGAVGAGTGTVCFGWKGGIGTASRLLPDSLGGYTLGALVQANYGSPADLTILGVPVGRYLIPPGTKTVPGPGSVMVVLATDAPLDPRALERLCIRASAGLARTGSNFAHGSGDFVIGFSTAYRLPHASPNPTVDIPLLVDIKIQNGLFRAAAEAVEESVLNALCQGITLTGRDGHTAYILPLEELRDLLQKGIGV